MLLYIIGMIPLSYTISSFTPIVTGDHDHRNIELLATGILGSLRYQYWLLKAMQAWEEKKHYPPYSAELPVGDNFEKALHDAGQVVWLFGATNWKKMFRLEIAEAAQEKPQPCSARSDDKNAKKTPYHWNFKLILRQDRKSPIFDELAEQEGFCLEQELRSLMAFVHHYGWLGAAPQNGLGWVEVQGEGLEQISQLKDNPVFAAKDILFSKQQANQLRVELVRYYKGKGFSSRYSKSLDYLDQNPPPIGYEIRRWLRDKMFHPEQYKNDQEKYFGNQKHAGFVHVTHPVVQPDGSWRIRMRFTVRPGESGGINPIAKPAAWLDDCCKLLKPEKPS